MTEWSKEEKEMLKKLLAVVLCLVFVLAATSVVWADEGYTEGVYDNPHKIHNKWDLSGTFQNYPGYDWRGLGEGTWTYRIHIKEAMDGQYSAGSIHFMHGDIDVTGHVTATVRNHSYWGGENLAAFGMADYNDVTYYFMLLYSKRAVWMALSTSPNVLGSRVYQVHSLNTYDFPFEYKAIH